MEDKRGKNTEYGLRVAGYDVPVLNEREVRAGTGILFLLMIIAAMLALLKNNFVVIKYSILVFFSDMFIRVVINPEFSPFLILGRLTVRNQQPEYSAAPQKRFAWGIGLTLSFLMVLHVIVFNYVTPLAGLICLLCLGFMFFETAFGICAGCTVYNMIYPDKAKLCPGNSCESSGNNNQQKISGKQYAIAGLFFTIVMLIIILRIESLIRTPEIFTNK